MTFIVNLKLDKPVIFPHSPFTSGPFILLHKNGDTRMDINLIKFEINSYGILDNYHEYWRYVDYER